jgi:hypothetical protein
LLHICHIARVSIAYRFVKGVASCKHASHICDILRVPL